MAARFGWGRAPARGDSGGDEAGRDLRQGGYRAGGGTYPVHCTPGAFAACYRAPLEVAVWETRRQARKRRLRPHRVVGSTCLGVHAQTWNRGDGGREWRSPSGVGYYCSLAKGAPPFSLPRPTSVRSFRCVQCNEALCCTLAWRSHRVPASEPLPITHLGFEVSTEWD